MFVDVEILQQSVHLALAQGSGEGQKMNGYEAVDRGIKNSNQRRHKIYDNRQMEQLNTMLVTYSIAVECDQKGLGIFYCPKFCECSIRLESRKKHEYVETDQLRQSNPHASPEFGRTKWSTIPHI